MYGLLQGQKKAHDTHIKLNRVLPKDTILGVRGDELLPTRLSYDQILNLSKKNAPYRS